MITEKKEQEDPNTKMLRDVRRVLTIYRALPETERAYMRAKLDEIEREDGGETT